ncbi:hypothetical protein NHL50_13050 [Acidimicrobiia bacterium EGI L10123]|uniref:hypothetical protein n=1 Tax=Salinilacustrithrix flava TaxID=2957203 RepID=UPI003D7C3407|nr:hypothetical protein [Acidimicrobiia bacterium EGI L10123]
MQSDDPPPQPVSVRPFSLVLAVLALLGVLLAVAGADTTVTDATGAAPIVDDAARQDPVQVEQSAHEVADSGPASSVDDLPDVRPHRCADIAEAPRVHRGCSPPTLRGPPGA